VLRGVGARLQLAGRLDDDVDAELAPGQLRRIGDRERRELEPGDS
jgi:hypothetical protein